MSKRAIRRHHAERLKRKFSKIGKINGWMVTDVLLGKSVNHGKLCNHWSCENRRWDWGKKSRTEALNQEVAESQEIDFPR